MKTIKVQINNISRGNGKINDLGYYENNETIKLKSNESRKIKAKAKSNQPIDIVTKD